MRGDRVLAAAGDTLLLVPCKGVGGFDSKVSLCRVLKHWLSLLEDSDPLYGSILEYLTSRPSETNAFLYWWGFDQDLTLTLGRQGSAPAMALAKQKNWDQAQTLEQKPGWTCEIGEATGTASEDLVNRKRGGSYSCPGSGPRFSCLASGKSKSSSASVGLGKGSWQRRNS